MFISISSRPPLFQLLQMLSSNKFGKVFFFHWAFIEQPNLRQLQPWRRSVDVQPIAPSCCLVGKPFLVFAARAIWVHTALRWFPVPVPVLSWFPQHTSLLMMWCSHVSSLILVMYSSPFPPHTFHLSTTRMHVRSCFFSTSGKAVHWRNQNSWMALLQAFQKTALSPFI